ncbi:hypothetical protein SteCoe_1503 [Stentor coeruleus]|uniref:Uncharacterized protein n=1 Tax=Stentor coeruleus TaxID=5963 RepID=A0A1R2D1P7_9CILI|nr:hypothetical protein SteCoe_1503 [Stentor coeruleus]
MSSLYRTEALKNSHYNPNGEGRDSYIYVNNGGVERNTYPYKFKEKSRVSRKSPISSIPQIDAKPLKYKSDGTGRDTYIGYNHGGLFASANKQTFYSSLRESSPVTLKPGFLQTQDVWDNTMTNWLAKRRKSQEAVNQKHLTRRLSLPKDSSSFTKNNPSN